MKRGLVVTAVALCLAASSCRHGGKQTKQIPVSLPPVPVVESPPVPLSVPQPDEAPPEPAPELAAPSPKP